MVEKIKTIFGIILLIGLIALLIYVWITPIKTVEPDEDSKIESLEKIDGIDGDTTIKIFIDEETGVNYLIYDSYRKGGITPRFNVDGSLYVE